MVPCIIFQLPELCIIYLGISNLQQHNTPLSSLVRVHPNFFCRCAKLLIETTTWTLKIWTRIAKIPVPVASSCSPVAQSDFQWPSSADSLQFPWCEIRVRAPTILDSWDGCFPCVLFSHWRDWGWGELLCCTFLEKEQWGQHVATSLTILMWSVLVSGARHGCSSLTSMF